MKQYHAYFTINVCFPQKICFPYTLFRSIDRLKCVACFYVLDQAQAYQKSVWRVSLFSCKFYWKFYHLLIDLWIAAYKASWRGHKVKRDKNSQISAILEALFQLINESLITCFRVSEFLWNAPHYAFSSFFAIRSCLSQF